MADNTNEEKELLVASIKTNLGDFDIELFSKEAPKTVENFVELSKKGYYKGVIFHRVIDGFMIQGGDPSGTGRGGESAWGGKFKDEFHPSLTFNSAGLLAMANAGPGTNGSQFFITLAPTMWLNNHHTIFGKVISGMEVVSAIGKTQTKSDRPVTDVVMNEVIIEKR
jgi:cyclophilin family peptidyl-prolyl cis-trans isomerase